MNSKSIVNVSLMVVVITVCSWITIPIFSIPITLQIFAIALTLYILGGLKGTMAVLIYILIGLIGVPVFSSFGSGFGILLGPTGGFLIGFIAMGLVYSLFSHITSSRHEGIHSLFFLFVGLIVCYLVAGIWYMCVNDSFQAALSIWLVPYFIFDVVKIVLAGYVGKKIPAMHKA